MTLVRRSRVSIIGALVLVVRVIIASVLGLLLLGGVSLVLSGLIVLTAFIAFTSLSVAGFVTRGMVLVVVIIMTSLFVKAVWTEEVALRIIERFVRKDVKAHLVGIPSVISVLPLVLVGFLFTVIVILTFNVSWLLVVLLEILPLVRSLRISRFFSHFTIFLLTTWRRQGNFSLRRFRVRSAIVVGNTGASSTTSTTPPSGR